MLFMDMCLQIFPPGLWLAKVALKYKLFLWLSQTGWVPFCIETINATKKVWKGYLLNNGTFWASRSRMAWESREKRLVLFLLLGDGLSQGSCAREPGLAFVELPVGNKGGSTWAFLSATPDVGQKEEGEWWGLKAVGSQNQHQNRDRRLQFTFLERAIYYSFSFVAHLFLCVLFKEYFLYSNIYIFPVFS